VEFLPLKLFCPSGFPRKENKGLLTRFPAGYWFHPKPASDRWKNMLMLTLRSVPNRCTAYYFN
jgi:hypothetical protein